MTKNTTTTSPRHPLDVIVEDIAPQYRREATFQTELELLDDGATQVTVNVGHSLERWIIRDGQAQITAKLPKWQGPQAEWVRCG